MLSRLRRLRLRFVHAFRPDRAEPDLAREVDSHLALLEDELVRRGMTREAAYTEARRCLGGVESAKHQHRDTRSFRWLDELLIDVKYALRRLRSRPATTALAIGMLAVAVGLSTAMFTIVDALIVRPLPFPHAERLTGLYMGTDTGGNTYVSSATFTAWRTSPGFDRVEGMAPRAVVVETDAGLVSHPGVVVTPGLFDLLGVSPVRGRLFEPGTSEPEAVVIGAALWRSAFQADEQILGRTIRLDDQPYIVIGVLPASFRFPQRDTSVWRARELRAGDSDRTQVVARLAPGVPSVDAFRMATSLSHSADPSTASFYARPDEVIWVADTYYRRAVPFVAGAVALVVIVLCANVASLLLTRLRARRREFGVCAALGASRGRLLRQVAMESLGVGLGGAAVGIAIASILTSLAESLLPEAFRQASLNPIDLDLRALSVSVAVGLVATFVAGAAPVCLATRAHGRAADPLSERGGTGSRSGRGVTRALLVTEVALACALLAGASLMVRSFLNVDAIDRGFDPRGMARIWFSFDESGITDPAGRRAAAADLRAEMLALPGVSDVAWSTGEGLYFGPWTSDLPDVNPVDLRLEVTAVDPDYFPLYGIELTRGRTFAATEEPGTVIVGETLANALWPGVDPIGHTFEWEKRQVRVVGVVREPRQSLINESREFADMFVPFEGPGRYVWLNVRCAVSCPSEGVFRQRTVQATRASLLNIRYLDEAFARDLEQPRASAALVVTFAIVGLIASAGGLFSVLSHAVQERRREFGIRSALGATPRAIASVVYREGLIVGGAGLLLGAAVAATFASTLEAISYDASASDPVGVTIVAATLVATIALALWRPARVAARTDPALLLKEE